MSGWSIIIAKQTPEERDAAPGDTASTLAKWEIGVGGIRWLEKLSEEGKAAQLSQGGYPTRFVSSLRAVLPLMTTAMTGCWPSTVVIHHERVSLCSLDQVLTIDVWDLS